MMDAALRYGNIAAWIIAGLAFYFTGQATTASDVSKLAIRTSITETKMEQEMLGYQVLQSSLGIRLDRIERKVDCLIDKRMCH